jgi:hypothetical protein
VWLGRKETCHLPPLASAGLILGEILLKTSQRQRPLQAAAESGARTPLDIGFLTFSWEHTRPRLLVACEDPFSSRQRQCAVARVAGRARRPDAHRIIPVLPNLSLTVPQPMEYNRMFQTAGERGPSRDQNAPLAKLCDSRYKWTDATPGSESD